MSGGIVFPSTVVPILGVKTRGADRVLQVMGEAVLGVGEVAGKFLAPTGLTATEADAANVRGDSNISFVNTGNVAQNAVVAISAGIRAVPVAVSGVVPGEAYNAIATGAVPTGYALHDCFCTVAGTLNVNVSAPLLALGQNYSIPVKVFKLS